MSNVSELISVIIPIYNRENTIERAVDSIFHQSISSWELILVDDGSRDRSGEICDAYLQRDRRIKVIHTDNLGVSHARNVGLDNAEGEWVAFLDSDDEYTENALELLLHYSKGAELVIGAGIYIPKNVVYYSETENPVSFDVHSEESSKLLPYIYRNACHKLFRRELITFRFDETMQRGEDGLFTLDYLRNITRVSYFPDVIYRYHVDTDKSLSKSFHSSLLYSAWKKYNAIVSIFHRPDDLLFAGSLFVDSATGYFYRLINGHYIDDSILPFIIQTQLDEYVRPVLPEIVYNKLPPNVEMLWQSVRSCSASEVIKCYKEHI